MEKGKKKILPQRHNRGLRMAELEKNEEKLGENDMYKDIFKEDSSDDDFNPSLDASSAEEAEVDNEDNEESESGEEMAPSKRRKEEEILDIDQIDIDKIDMMEDLRDQGVDVSDEEELEKEIKKRKFSSEDSDDYDDEDYESKRKKKKKKPNKKKKPVIKKKSTIISIENEAEAKPQEESKEEDNTQVEVLISDKSSENLISKKRKRTNKFESLLKKPKRERINKNVTIVGSRNNPKSIIIHKNIYNEKEITSENNDKEKFNENTISFNLEQELDTKNIIKKYKQQEKEKKQFGFQDKIISQEQRLLESIFTEWENKNSLKAMQKLDEFNKRENTTTNKKSFIDYVKTVNSEKHIIEQRNENKIPNKKEINKVDVTFSNVTYYNKIFSFFNSNPRQIQEPKKCAITGNPAKYYDPLTKSYYSTIESFKLLRERYFQKEEDGLLFRIQTLSDLASQKKERLKKLLLTDEGSSLQNGAQSSQLKQNINSMNTNDIMNMVNKFGILRNDGNEYEKRVISHRIYNRNRENCVESGMLLEASKIKLVISKKIFKDKYSSKLPS